VRMYFYRYVTALFAAVMMVAMTITTFAAETDVIDDTTMLSEELLWDGKIPADISWKTKQDKGQWIEELEVLDGAGSLILVVNRSDEENGESTLMYLSKNTEDVWMECFSVDCLISGGESMEKEDLYGVYNPVQTFGNMKNPGSLLPYREVTGDDFWVLDPNNERFGEIQTVSSSTETVLGAVNLKAMKVFFNYGMIVKSPKKDQVCTSLLLNCFQNDANDGRFTGIQVPEDSLRMLVQCVDEETCMIVVGSIDELEEYK